MCKDIIELEKAMDFNFSFEDDAELIAIEESMKKTNEEIKKLSILQDDYDEDDNNENKNEDDRRSVFVGNIAHGTTSSMLEAFFSKCGTIKRVIIFVNKITGKPKGFAYIEFELSSSVEKALKMNGYKLRSMPLQVMSKMPNKPRLTTTNRPTVVSADLGNRQMSQVDSMRISEHFKSICSGSNVARKIAGALKTKYSVKRLGVKNCLF